MSGIPRTKRPMPQPPAKQASQQPSKSAPFKVSQFQSAQPPATRVVKPEISRPRPPAKAAEKGVGPGSIAVKLPPPNQAGKRVAMRKTTPGQSMETISTGSDNAVIDGSTVSSLGETNTAEATPDPAFGSFRESVITAGYKSPPSIPREKLRRETLKAAESVLQRGRPGAAGWESGTIVEQSFISQRDSNLVTPPRNILDEDVLTSQNEIPMEAPNLAAIEPRFGFHLPPSMQNAPSQPTTQKSTRNIKDPVNSSMRTNMQLKLQRKLLSAGTDIDKQVEIVCNVWFKADKSSVEKINEIKDAIRYVINDGIYSADSSSREQILTRFNAYIKEK